MTLNHQPFCDPEELFKSEPTIAIISILIIPQTKVSTINDQLLIKAFIKIISKKIETNPVMILFILVSCPKKIYLNMFHNKMSKIDIPIINRNNGINRLTEISISSFVLNIISSIDLPAFISLISGIESLFEMYKSEKVKIIPKK